MDINKSLELVIQNEYGKDVTTSVIVANCFGKNHKNVLRDIENLTCSEEFNQLNFEPISYFDVMNREQKAYEMTKDGFSFLVMGYTGEKASTFKEAFIREFNKREALLKNDDYIMHRALEISKKRYEIAEEKILSQQSYIEILKPQAEIAVQFVLSYGEDTIASVAKCFGYGRNEFFEILRNRKMLQSKGRERNQPYSDHVKAGYFTVKFPIINNGQRTVAQTFVTSKGKTWIQKKLKEVANYQSELPL